MDEWLQFGEKIISVIVALGGFEFVKWLATRKSRMRIADAQADREDFQVLKDATVFLQEQLKEKEVRFADQTEIVRKQNSKINELTIQVGKLELENQRYRCVVEHCPKREPQNGY